MRRSNSVKSSLVSAMLFFAGRLTMAAKSACPWRIAAQTACAVDAMLRIRPLPPHRHDHCSGDPCCQSFQCTPCQSPSFPTLQPTWPGLNCPLEYPFSLQCLQTVVPSQHSLGQGNLQSRLAMPSIVPDSHHMPWELLTFRAELFSIASILEDKPFIISSTRA